MMVSRWDAQVDTSEDNKSGMATPNAKKQDYGEEAKLWLLKPSLRVEMSCNARYFAPS